MRRINEKKTEEKGETKVPLAISSNINGESQRSRTPNERDESVGDQNKAEGLIQVGGERGSPSGLRAFRVILTHLVGI